MQLSIYSMSAVTALCLQVMVCQPAELKPFADFAIWGDDAGPAHVWDEDSRMFLPRAYHEGFVAKLEELVCGHKPPVSTGAVTAEYHTLFQCCSCSCWVEA